MKFTCLQEKLRSDLEKVERIIGRNITLPILQNILLEGDTEGLRISSTDLEIGISTVISGKVEKNGRITVPARAFVNFIYNLPQENINLEVKTNILYVEAGTYKATFFGEKAEEFPLIPQVKKEHSFIVPSNEFAYSLSQVISSVSLSNTRPELTGVLLVGEKKTLSFVTTDSFRLSEKVLDLASSNTSFSIIIPSKTTHEVIRIFGAESRELAVIIQSTQIMFKTNDTKIVSRVIEGEFPQYQSIIPKIFR